MADTVADVLVRLGVNTDAMRAGFREARNQTEQFASDFARTISSGGGILETIGGVTRAAGGVAPGAFGSVLRGVGGALSSIGRLITDLFSRAARNIARSIRAEMSATLAGFHAGAIALAEAIRQIETDREEAIRRLSGRKGGRKELEQLLPGIDSALAQLRDQQSAIFEQFDSRLEMLRTGAAFRDVAADVREAVGQYRAYVDAGGDLASANEFLSRSLEEIRSQSAADLAAGETQAIEDALELNDLLREREQLLAQFAADEQAIRSRGVLERQLTVAQQKSAELEALRQQRDERLADLDQNIRLQQRKVDSEARVFDLARDRVALETRLLELRAQEFDREAAQLAALRDIVAGIVPAAAGPGTVTPALAQQLNLGTLQVFVGAGATPAQAQQAGENVIEGMLRGLAQERARLGLVN